MEANTNKTTKRTETKSGVIYHSQRNKSFPASLFTGKKLFFLIFFFLLFIPIVIYLVSVARFQGSSREITLTYWGLWEPKSVYDELIKQFERDHPGIKIVYEKKDIRSLGKYIERLSSKINSGEPDIFRYHNSWIPQLTSLLLPFPSDVVSELELDTKYYNVIKKDLKIEGAYYGVPLEIDTLSLFVNTDLFQNAGISEYPTDWNELLAAVKQLTEKDAKGRIITSGVAMGRYDNIDHASDLMSLLFIQNGANLRNLTDKKTLQNAEDALLFYTSFSNSFDIGAWDETFENSKLAFAKGKVAMIFGYSWDLLDIIYINPKLNFQVIPVPHLPDRTMTIASYWVEGVSAKSNHPKEAFEFLKYIAKRESLEKLYQNEVKLRPFGEAYPRLDMAELLKDNKYLYPIVSQANDAVSTFFSSDTYDGAMNTALNAYLGNAIRSVEGGAGSLRSSLETLSQGVDTVLKKYEKPSPQP